MSSKELAVMTALLLSIGVFIAFQFPLFIPKEKLYDCRVAEISSDVPPAVKQMCRDAKGKK